MSRVDPYEELASLFLTDSARRHDGATGSVHEHSDELEDELVDPPNGNVVASTLAPIEIGLVGHLPVMGGLWLTQYADQVARREGPTALVRLERGQVSVELLRAPGHRGELDTIDSVDEALHFLAAVARHWIVCPQGEAALDGPFAGDALTLLTGADDAATVAAYRIVKSFAERWHSAGWPVPPVGLIVLGATPERVGQVVEKLDRTTKAFLDVDLVVTGHYQRMDAIESAGRRTFAGLELGVADVCARVRLTQAAAQARARSSTSRAEVPPLRAVTRSGLSAPVAPGAPVAKLGPKGIVRDVVRPQSPERARPAVVTAPSVDSQAALIPGIEPLPVRCPAHTAVELAVDVHGSLHLVVALDALASLRAVEVWAIAHAELLRMACPRVVSLERITGHVVTTDATSIIPLHGSGLKLHLLVQSAGGWVHAALS